VVTVDTKVAVVPTVAKGTARRRPLPGREGPDAGVGESVYFLSRDHKSGRWSESSHDARATRQRALHRGAFAITARRKPYYGARARVHLFLLFRAAGPPAGPRRCCDSVSLWKQSQTVLGQLPFAVGRMPIHDPENAYSQPGEELFPRQRGVIHQWCGGDPDRGRQLTHDRRNEDRPALRREESQRKTGRQVQPRGATPGAARAVRSSSWLSRCRTRRGGSPPRAARTRCSRAPGAVRMECSRPGRRRA